MWEPEIGNGGGPRYQAIADAIARDVNQGRLAAGQKLPTHRELAALLGVTVGTVTRGYAEAERRGLTQGEVGRGTFVRGPRHLDAFERPASGGAGVPLVADMSLALPWCPPDGSDGRALASTLRALADQDLEDMLAYQPDTAPRAQLETFASFMRSVGVPAFPDRLLLTAGSQHGLLVTLSALLAPGDHLLTGELTYPGMKSLARTLGLRLRGVPLDSQGLIPDALDRMFRETGASAVYCIPMNQNPTCVTMGEERRLEVAEVAWSHDALIIEDDPYRLTATTSTPTLFQLAPERTIHVSTVAKAMTFGLRVGFLAVPAAYVDRLKAAVRASMWMAPPLMGQITAQWIRDGTAADMMARKSEELAARHRLLEDRLGGFALTSHPSSIHAWLRLPEPWRSPDFVTAARDEGVQITGAEAFAVGRQQVTHAVRLSLGQAPHRERLAEALDRLGSLLERGGAACAGVF